MEGRIHSFETLGMLDGPGRRFVLFMQGCRLRCRYCHNPDSWSEQGGQVVTVEEIVERVLRLKSFYVGGGVTVSGGEPLLQPQFIEAFLKRCRAEGFHTCIDTAGIELDDATRAALLSADLILIDLKTMDETLHLKMTGSSASIPRKTIAFLEEQHRPYWVRHVLVPGWTDRPEQLHELGAYLSQRQGLEQVELLPFHQLAAYKWENLGLKYSFADLPTPTASELQEAAKILRGYGVPLHG